MSLSLPDVSTDAGVLARLLIAESRNPAAANYDAGDVNVGLFAMKSTVVNRLANDPSQFLAPGALNWTDIIVAPGQFAGFSRNNGQLTIAPSVEARIQTVLQRANSGPPGPYAQFVQNVLNVVASDVADPFADLSQIGNTLVVGGSYGWRTAGSSEPGGRLVKIPESMNGTIAGNQFYTLRV